MKKVERSELLALDAYEGIRERFGARIIALKKNRRIAVGEHMTFVFENRDTVLFQIQEMLRTERITKSTAIDHELATYNDLVPDDGELSATLLIEYDDANERGPMLLALAGLGDHVALRVGDREAKAVFRPLPGEEPDRLPAVNYVRFPLGADAAALLRDASVPAALEVSHPSYRARADLAPAVRVELASDLED
jgi:hypothetical protein